MVLVLVEVVSTKCWTNCVVKIIFINPAHVYPPAPSSLALSNQLSFLEFKQIILLYILYILFPAHFTKLGLEVLSNLLPLSQTITVMNDRRRTFAYICLMMARTEYS